MELIEVYNEYVQAINTVKRMRYLQTRYFKTKSFDALRAAKSLEKEVDTKIENLKSLEQRYSDKNLLPGLLEEYDGEPPELGYFKAISILYKAMCTAQEHANDTNEMKEIAKAFTTLCQLIPDTVKK